MRSAARALAAAVMLAAGVAAADGFEGKVVGVSDGDTLTVLRGREEVRVRLAWVDAPETGHGKSRPGQPFGQAAKRSLSELCFGRQARIEVVGRDRYGRAVGHAMCEGRDANLEQVRRGMAWAYVRHHPPAAIVQAEAEARAAGRGLWSDRGPVPPWEWRRVH